ncbi:MAG: UvrD-helicase domain-containing protein [Cephaloticoccus sp.]
MTIGHQMILASAGSGKTYALTNRFVRLLALGAAPERIVALTFTRKAAGEFFDAILHKLAAAATDGPAAARLAREIAVDAGPAEFLGWLRQVVDAMHRLKLGTLDGFFARVARNFPFELGLAGAFEVLEEHAAIRARSRVLQQLFARSGQLSTAQQEFMEAFKQATFGREEKRLADKLVRFLQEHQGTYLDAPDRELWGNPARIWPEGSELLAAGGKVSEALAALRSAAATGDWDERRLAWWDRLFANLETWTPGTAMGTELQNVLRALPDMAVVTMDRKKVEPDEPLRAALRATAQAVVRAELVRRLAMTAGLHAVIGAYEEDYHRTVRRTGRLTFADVQRLLLPGSEGGRLLSTRVDDRDRMLIDYRLDAGIDHWLLDEFQDTSFGQWSVLKNLIDEVVQDPAGTRSFFYVGDVKQSIYAWREGDPRLFREIFDHYNAAAPGTIAEHHLDQSWRAGPPVIAMVNAVFGADATLAALFPGPAAAAWNREWREHASARPGLGGYAALLHAADEAGRFATTLDLLRELPAPRPGFSIAVLVQKNDTATRLADYLRREGGLAAVAEADLHVCVDHPTGAVLLALVQAAAHPGDTLAWQHVQMSPLGAVLADAGVGSVEALAWRLPREIANDGLAVTLDAWWRRLAAAVPPDAFTRQRMRHFLAAAAEFDAGGSRDATEFIEFMTRYTLREPDSAAVVRVMTIHKSKGLGFDVVVLPDLEGQRLNQARKGLAVQRDDAHQVNWVLDLPTKDIVACDPVLSRHLAEAEASACYEKLSLLYVAMTRAKRALYAIIEPPRASSSSHNIPKLLTDTLGSEPTALAVGQLALTAVWHEGDPAWAQKLAPAEPDRPVRHLQTVAPAEVERSRRLVARRPSDERAGSWLAERLLAPVQAGRVDFGRAVHWWLATIEWADSPAPDWTGAGEAGAGVRECLAAPELARVWNRRPGADLWRERPFEAVVDGQWLTGVFDRVIVERDGTGRPVRADVFDFKTDEDVEGALGRHHRQLGFYRAAAARLLGLEAESVACYLVMTKSRTCVEVPAT